MAEGIGVWLGGSFSGMGLGRINKDRKDRLPPLGKKKLSKNRNKY